MGVEISQVPSRALTHSAHKTACWHFQGGDTTPTWKPVGDVRAPRQATPQRYGSGCGRWETVCVHKCPAFLSPSVLTVTGEHETETRNHPLTSKWNLNTCTSHLPNVLEGALPRLYFIHWQHHFLKAHCCHVLCVCAQEKLRCSDERPGTQRSEPQKAPANS